MTNREKAKAVIKRFRQDGYAPESEIEQQQLAILKDYANDMLRRVIAERHHCSEATVDRRVSAALQRWFVVTD